MKPCPYCAELIQDAAAKCRFCGEWLDPSKRPAWSQGGGGAVASVATPAPTPVAPAPERPATPTIVPAPKAVVPAPPTVAPQPAPSPRPSAPSWEAPSAWLAHSHTGEQPRVSAAAQTFVEAPIPSPGRPAPVRRDTLQEGAPGQSSIEEVALRMQRIKASAAAVRQAVEERMQAPAAEPQRPSDSSAQTKIDGPRPEPSASPASLSYPGAEPPAARRGATVPAFQPPGAPYEPPAPSEPPVVAAPAYEAPPAYEPPPQPEIVPQQPSAPAPVVEERAFKTQHGEFEDDDDDDDDFGGGFGFDDEDDDDDDDDFSGDASGFGDIAAPAARPLPWRPIAAGAAVVVLVGGFLMRDRLFGSSETETPAAADAPTKAEGDAGDAKSGSVAPPTKAQTPPAAGEGTPVIAEADSAAGVGEGDPTAEDSAAADGDTAAAEPTAGAVAPPPAALPPEALAKLDEARETYKKANGRKGPLQDAKSQLDEVLAVAPNHPDALLILAQVQLELGDMDASLASAEKCVKLAAEQADCWLTIGTIKQEKKEVEVAAEAYERYLALAPDGRYAGTIRKLLKRLK